MERVDARTLLTPRRLDYVVKWRFFRHLVENDDPDSERVYRWHIMERTGGVEPGRVASDRAKTSVDDYVSAARALLHSIEENGFDKSGAVNIGANGLITRGTGAHRIAACLALEVKIRVNRVKKDGVKTWGFDWFSNHGMAEADLTRLTRDWCFLRDQA